MTPEAPQAWRSHGDVAVLGTGSALPGKPVPTASLLDRVRDRMNLGTRTLAEAIAQRLNIQTRHVSRTLAERLESPLADASNAALGARALRAALDEAGLEPADLGYLVTHTATPGQPLPSGAARIADLVGFAGPHIEIRQACTGFANALMIAFGLLAPRRASPIAIVGSETGSLFFDLEIFTRQRGQLVNLVQMGDGAGAIILGPAGAARDRLYGAWYGATGLHRAPGLEMREGGSDRPFSGPGPLLFSHDFAAIAREGAGLFDAAANLARSQAIAPDNAGLIIPHQVSGRIGEHLARHFDLPVDRFFVNADRIGNTGSAAIWIALDEIRKSGRAKNRECLVLGAEATKYMHGGFVHAG